MIFRRRHQKLRDRIGDYTKPTEPITPRKAAILLLLEKIADGDAGLDPYDPTIVILNAGRNERTWAYRALELTGTVLRRADILGGGQRLRALLSPDIRLELGLDRSSPPIMADEPLASRGVTQITDGITAMAAVERAHATYDARYPYGITEVH